MGVLDDDDNEDEEEQKDDNGTFGENTNDDENVKDEEDLNQSTRASDASSKKNLRDVARKLWLAVEVGDKLATLKILQT